MKRSPLLKILITKIQVCNTIHTCTDILSFETLYCKHLYYFVEINIESPPGLFNGSDYDDDDALDVPLASTSLFKNAGTGLQLLQNFISSTVNLLGMELDMTVDRNKDILTQSFRKYKNGAFDLINL